MDSLKETFCKLNKILIFRKRRFIEILFASTYIDVLRSVAGARVGRLKSDFPYAKTGV